MDTGIRNVSFLNSIVKCRAQNKFLARQSAAAPAKKSAGTETLGIGVMDNRDAGADWSRPKREACFELSAMARPNPFARNGRGSHRPV